MTSSSSEIQTWEVKEPYLKLHCKLGEGPYYERATNTLRFVDIISKRLHTVDLAQGPGSLVTQQLDTPVSVTADIAGVDPRDRILIGAKYGIAVLDRKKASEKKDAYEYVAKFHKMKDNLRLRGNDGAVDPHGRFWLGTMTDFELGPFQSEGSVHMFTGRQDSVVLKEGVTIPNSVSWSPDGQTMYFTHSSAKEILAYDYSSAAGSAAISNERVFYAHQGTGDPDGHRIDVEGNLWTAVYGESHVLKVSGKTGKVIGEVKLPTQNITCVEFVGTELFITTAGMEEGAGTEQEVDYSGGLFRVDVGVEGVPPHEFKLDL
ncbi:SMP-30/Gluconolaconase/LRE-like region [Apiospora marii]|uniref:SMP-30/Gluconolaconase/LRE-like region n=1 Tax=Apiospora marii TaxID=335849 RepID=A0ABR1RKR6_9PEZI